MTAMLLIIATWMLAHMIMVGIGNIVAKAMHVDLSSPEDYWRLFWVGWGVAIVFTQIWHFLFPINDTLRFIMAAIGIVSYFWHGKKYLKIFHNRFAYILLALLFLLAIGLSNQALLPNPDVDDGLYGLQVVRWVTEYPVVPGLGNLHDRLAFSNGYFYYPALFNTSFWLHRVSHVSTGLLYMMLIATFATSALELIVNKQRYLYQFAQTVLLFDVLINAMGTDVFTISNDHATFLIGYVLIAYTWKYLEKHQTLNRSISFYHLFTINLIASISILIKFSSAIFSILLALTALLAWLWHRRFQFRDVLQGVLLGLGVSASILIPMMIRSTLQTGYILYPVTSFGQFQTQWTLPESWGQTTVDWIRAWARMPKTPPEQVLGNWNWFGFWWQEISHNTLQFQIPTTLTLVSLGGVVVIILLQKIKLLQSSEYTFKVKALFACVLLSTISAFVFWFLTAPSMLFIGAIPYATGATAIVLLLMYLPNPMWRNVIALALTLIFGYLIVRKFLQQDWVIPEQGTIIYPQRIARTSLETTNSGLGVYIPETEGLCWSSELPCSPRLNPRLQLRNSDDMRHGFMLQQGS